LNRVNYLYNHPEDESFDVLEFNDGRVFERYSRLQRIRNKIIDISQPAPLAVAEETLGFLFCFCIWFFEFFNSIFRYHI